jgi:hypothetical protein
MPWVLTSEIAKCTHRITAPAELGDDDNKGMISATTLYCDDVVVITARGCMPNAKVATVIINYQAEYIPKSSIAQLIEMKLADPGP